jgi:hypothetical protein
MRMVDIDKGQVVHLLQQQVARVIENIAARMVIHQRQKTLKGHAVVQIFPGCSSKQTSTPCSSKVSRIGRQRGQLQRLLKALLVMRRPRIEKRPRQRAGKGGVRFQP